MAHHLYIDGKLVEGILTLPDGLVNIYRNALAGIVDITAAVIPGSVKITGSFAGCEKLEYIVFCGSPDSVGDHRIFENTNLKHVYLSDSKDEAIYYIPYLATACKSVNAKWHYADEWHYDEENNPTVN